MKVERYSYDAFTWRQSNVHNTLIPVFNCRKAFLAFSEEPPMTAPDPAKGS